MSKNLAIIHGGGPTCVINASLYGAINKAKVWSEIGHIYGVLGGIEGLFDGNMLCLENLPDEKLEKLPFTPGSALGTSRMKITDEEYTLIHKKLQEWNIGYLLMNGGNGTMTTCARLLASAISSDSVQIVGIPKTVDNDLLETDHSPGYGSSARYTAVSALELGFDLKSMPRQVTIMETMGRNAGWLAGAAALANPQLIYFPERPFDENQFLQDVKKLYHENGHVLVIAAEGLTDSSGKTITPPILTRGRDVYFGYISAYLSQLVIEKLEIKARGEKPGILGRASVALQSSVDREEAIQAGSFAVQALMEGKTGVFAGMLRTTKSGAYSCKSVLIPFEKVMNGEKKLPDQFINANGNGVTQAFIEYASPLIGGALPEYQMLD